MRITKIQEKSIHYGTNMQNAVIDFSQMTSSVAVIVTDVIQQGKPLVGYGFNSNGRYGQSGILRERFDVRGGGLECEVHGVGESDRA